MTQPPTPASGSPAPWKPIDERQRRVLGVLIEKAKTTPAGYPMSVNSIVVGCNQKNNRDPLTAYDDVDVEQALDGLRVLGVVSEIDWTGRVSKYKHNAYDWLGVTRAEMAVMTELLLRGPQTLGDLRARAARMEPIEDQAALRPIVDALLARGLMLELSPAGRGQIVSHALYLGPELEALRARHAGGAAVPAAAPVPRPAVERMPAASDEVAALRAQLADLAERVARLEARLESAGG